MSAGSLAGAVLWNGTVTCDGGGCWAWGLTLAELFWIQTFLPLVTLLPLVLFMYELPIRGGAGVAVDLRAMWRETFDFLARDGVWVPLMFMFIFNFCYISNPARGPSRDCVYRSRLCYMLREDGARMPTLAKKTAGTVRAFVELGRRPQAWTNFLFLGLEFTNFGYGMLSFVGAVPPPRGERTAYRRRGRDTVAAPLPRRRRDATAATPSHDAAAAAPP